MQVDATRVDWWPSPWGEGDELGMLNHVTPAKRAEALRLVREGRLYDLGDVIGVDDLIGIEPEPGDAVLFHTGWSAHWDDAETYLGGEPGPGLAVAEWLAVRGVALTGCDTWSYGPVPAENPARPFEVPQLLNVRYGVFVVENLD